MTDVPSSHSAGSHNASSHGASSHSAGLAPLTPEPLSPRPHDWVQLTLRITLVLFFLTTSVLHVVYLEEMTKIVPPIFPAPEALVIISGIAEFALALAVLFDRTRQLARWGLMALLVAVFPANIYMAFHPELFPDIEQRRLFGRLPLQGVFLLWVWLGTE